MNNLIAALLLQSTEQIRKVIEILQREIDRRESDDREDDRGLLE